MIRDLLIQMAQELEFQFDASKGGNVRGITEDHRYEMLCQLRTLRSVIADKRNQLRRYRDPLPYPGRNAFA